MKDYTSVQKSRVAGHPSATLSKSKLQYKYFSTDLSNF